MKNILNFLIEAGKLKHIKRTGIMFYGVKDADSAIDHSFRMALMAWIFAKDYYFLRQQKSALRKPNIEKILKMALIHDICKVYTGDITPYDDLLPKNKKEREEFVGKWRRLPLKEKKKRHYLNLKKEFFALKKLVSKLPKEIRKEMTDIWFEYHRGKSSEAKFVLQLDTTENLIEALEQWKKNKNFPTRPWWEHTDEVIDDPVLLDFLRAIEKEETGNKK